MKNSSDRTRWLALLNLFNLKPVVYDHTRIAQKSKSCIDNILINFPKKNISNKDKTNHYSGIGDHKHAQIVSFPVGTRKNQVNKILTRSFKENKVQKFKEALSTADFSPVYSHNDVNKKTCSFYGIFQTLFDMHFPLKLISIVNKKKSWITRGIQVSSEKKRALFELTKFSEDPAIHERYRSYSKILHKIVREAKRLDSVNTIKTAPKQNKSKAVWQVIRDYSKAAQKRHETMILEEDGNVVENPEEVAEIINTFFVNITQTILPNSNNTPVPVNSNHSDSSVPLNSNHSDSSVPLNSNHSDSSVPVNSNHSDSLVTVNSNHSDSSVPVNSNHSNSSAPIIFDHSDSSIPVNSNHLDSSVPFDSNHSDSPVPVNFNQSDSSVPVIFNHLDSSAPVIFTH
ncbi:hypothetical protein WDU94_000588 [Cyamophila willieti]